MTDLLVVAGEASGDRIAGAALRELRRCGVSAWGLGGPACAYEGMELLADVERTAAMGVVDVVERAPQLALALSRLLARVWASPPRAALLVDFTELNARLGALLRRRGVPVLWCVAPQVWAWRAGRLASLRTAIDRLAVVLPFEEGLWRRAGYDAHYIGHPSMHEPTLSRQEARERLGIKARSRALALLPGSRPAEVRRLLEPFVEAARRLLAEGQVDAARVIIAASLDPATRALVEQRAARASIGVATADAAGGAMRWLRAFDVALAASGTASLEAALAGASPVVAYRMDRLGFALARRLVRTSHIALPNVLLGERVYPELVQDEVTPARLVAAARSLIGREPAHAAAKLRALLTPSSAGRFGLELARLCADWLGVRELGDAAHP